MENIYQKYHVHHVINASGKMTILGGSRVKEDVCQHMMMGAQQFFEIKDLLDQTGQFIASCLDVEAAYIVNSASGGIAQCIAACVSQGKLKYILDIHHPENVHRDIVLCKGHNVDYGTPIELTISVGGGHVVEAGYANTCTLEHVKAKINENTAALVYVKSHHCVQKGMPDMKDFIALGHDYHIPVIIDAAAEEDLKKYLALGADAVIYSGTKALEGPTSGLVIGKKDFIDLVKKQSQGIGRVMKVGKESILGLTYAIEKYASRKPLTLQEQSQRLSHFNDQINAVSGLKARGVQDGAGRAIMRSEISFDEGILSMSALEVAKRLKEGDLCIYTRDYRANEGKIEIDVRDVTDEELQWICDKIIQIVRG